MDNEVLVLFTMDVELPTSGDGLTSGPASLAEGARRTREYYDVLRAAGYTPTYFIHPELGETQAGLFGELRAAGACLGLHVHAVKFRPVPSPCELGGLAAAAQTAVLTAAAAMFERHFSERPTLFRPGCFSANDETYGVLHRLGFVGGSVSIPGRVWPARHCVWAGAEPHPHYAHAAFRQLPGDLPFVEIPLSVDRVGGLRRHALGFDYYPDLRPGGVYTAAEDSGRDHAAMLAHLAEQLATERPLLRTIVVDVHNDREFADPRSDAGRQLREVLDGLVPALARVGLRPVGATFAEAVRRYREVAAYRSGRP